MFPTFVGYASEVMPSGDLRALAARNVLRVMSDKDRVMEFVQKPPEDSTLEQIHREPLFVAGLRAAEVQADRGELIDHARIREKLSTWTSSWSGHHLRGRI